MVTAADELPACFLLPSPTATPIKMGRKKQPYSAKCGRVCQDSSGSGLKRALLSCCGWEATQPATRRAPASLPSQDTRPAPCCRLRADGRG